MGQSARCQKLLAEGEALLERFGVVLPDPNSHCLAANRVLERLSGERGAYLAAACQCLCIARLLHSGAISSPQSVLLGDFFQSRFTDYLLRLDAPWLQAAFARFLADDAARALSLIHISPVAWT